jgi:Protein of unknown function (DUF1566)
MIMINQRRVTRRVRAAVALACAGFALATSAGAVDLRDWGRKLPAGERFVVLSQFNSEAVLDKETQLVWQRTPSAFMLAPRSSAAFACATRSVGGRLGWRLPSLHEMQSLADPAAALGSLALPVGHPFLSVPVGQYWTETRISGQTTGAIVDLGSRGQNKAKNIVDPAYYWCVRAGGFGGEI